MGRNKPLSSSFRKIFEVPFTLIWNLGWIYVAFSLCRIVFWLANRSYFPDLNGKDFIRILEGGLVFDTSAILYTNILYLFLMLLPLPAIRKSVYQYTMKWLFMITNSVAILANLADVVYFPYTNRRTTITVFSEFSSEGNLGLIVSKELLNHWYLVLFAILLICIIFRFYRKISEEKYVKTNPWLYYPLQLLYLVLTIPVIIFGIRGGIGKAVRPIAISNANQYVQRPLEAAIVLNTPFSIYRTIGKDVFRDPGYFADEKELEQIFSPIHHPKPDKVFQPMNVVILIVESFGREYIGALNKDLEGGNYKGYTPFVDSLIGRSLTYQYSFSNGRKSIDGMPSVLSGIPMFIEPFFLTPASLNNVGGLARSLGEKGYYSAFFHGAKNGSMGFEAFARATGFKDYFGRTEFNADKRFEGDADFDGTWAIWDEPFLQFYCEKMNEFQQPFVTAVFTASSHHPFSIPEKYSAMFPEEGLPIHKCIRYTDYSLKRFFENASRQSWYHNTIFVLTSDHTNQSDHIEYQTDLGGFSVPIVFYIPGDSTLRGIFNGISQQIDILPTVLGYLGYDKPYFSFGCDLLRTPVEQMYAVNYLNGIYQYVKGEFLLQFDGEKTVAVYNFKEDQFLKENLIGRIPVQSIMEIELKAIIQQYMQRMLQDRISIQ